MRTLKSRIYEKLEYGEGTEEKFTYAQGEIACVTRFGPAAQSYSMVKDLRTGVETGNAGGDGWRP